MKSFEKNQITIFKKKTIINNTTIVKDKTRKNRILKHLGNVRMAIVSIALTTSSTLAAPGDAASASSEVLGTEGSKEVLNTALKAARSKPALLVATTITCIAFIPVSGAAASPGLCIACGILIAKTFG